MSAKGMIVQSASTIFVNCRGQELAANAARLRAQDEALQQAQQRAQADATQLAARDEQIASLREQALVLEKE